MTIIGIIRLLRKHLVLLLFIPILMGGLVIFLTQNPSFNYSSETTLYTGLASGSSVEMGKSLSYFATNTDFDNLINVINSRETQQEVSIRLLAQHLLLPKADHRFISTKSFGYLREITPSYIKLLVLKSYEQVKKLNGIQGNSNKTVHTFKVGEQESDYTGITANESVIDTGQSDTASTFSFSKLYSSSKSNKMFPASIDEAVFEQTVKDLTALCTTSDTNFVSNLLNFTDPHYSIDAISSINVQRIGSSDLVRLRYTSNDPGICQQTLLFLTEVCIKNYKVLKENRSDAVVKYFEYQVLQATQKLKSGEDKLLSFNKDNNIINYYEQSKAVAGAKEALDVDYNNMRIKLAGIEAEITHLEEKLQNQQKIQLKSAPILEKRNELSQINTKIATAETIGYGNTSEGQNLPALKAAAEKLKEEIRVSVAELYKFGNSTEGLPVSTLLNEWISNVLKYEDTKAGLVVLSKRIQDFQKQYEIFAPAGANLKRIEREISVSEQEFLELLHGLNLAKLKMQDLELSSNLKAIDQPFYPVTPNPTKRKFLILGASMFGFLIVLTIILALEFFDDTLRTPNKASKILNILLLGVFPKIYLKTEIFNFGYFIQRLVEMMVQQIERLKKEKNRIDKPFQILVFSTSNNEGKTVIAHNIASQLRKLGNKVAVIGYFKETLNQPDDPNYGRMGMVVSAPEYPRNTTKRFSIIYWLLGYPDNRINYQSRYLYNDGASSADEDYYEYLINDDFVAVANYKKLKFKKHPIFSAEPDYVVIEIPPILYYPYPSTLVASADLPLMVCRSNRIWSQADQGALENISKITSSLPHFVLNGVEMEVIESIIGELPKKRSFLRRKLKNIVRFQFQSNNQL